MSICQLKLVKHFYMCMNKTVTHGHRQSGFFVSLFVCSFFLSFFLYKYGFDHVWENQGVGNKETFLKMLEDRFLASYEHEWFQTIERSERCILYSALKSKLTMSTYVQD